MSPHSGQNFGGLDLSSGTQPHLSHLKFIDGLPQFEQNLPLFVVPQLQVQPSAGFCVPQLLQNFPVLTVPHEQVQEPSATGF